MLNILLIDDSPRRVGLVRKELERAGTSCRLHTVGAGPDATKYLAQKTPFEKAPMPDLVLFDCTQPLQKNLAFLDKLRTAREFDSVSLAVLTRPSTEATIESNFSTADSCVIFSPIELGSFLKTMNSMRRDRFMNAVSLIGNLGLVLVRAPETFDAGEAPTSQAASFA